ncbi:exo-alpha-sialidase [Rhodocytophaga rosea]|uniref:exo-alpha-sialidase n=1 Tax=Rhodocytophaga rosea TaxID=2704465 RepID=A0A6C0GS23_9BACT|nr:sialidase family protein [Rhodocytophaga rosea]QHT70737.1 exo-alpha-sialidase [Rhodocytophaga rosea]
MKRMITGLFVLIAFCVTAQEKKFSMAAGLNIYQDLFNKTMSDSVTCFRIPSIITAPNGDLIAAIDERVPSCGDLKFNPDINIVIRRSSDGGKTWSPIEKVVNFPLGQSASDPSMIVDQTTKEIFLFYNFMDVVQEKDVYYFHMVKSKDNGKSWSTPADLTSQLTKPEWRYDFKFITSGQGIQTGTGKLLHTIVHLKQGVYLFGSDDHGKTWYFIDHPIQPADESKVIELSDGTWMVNARVNTGGMRYVHTSSDEGKHWTSKADSSLIDPGCNASIIRYPAAMAGDGKNRLLFSNVKTKEGRSNLTVRISYDEGKTWTAGKTVYTGPAAYSDLTILKNGDIGLFFEKDEYKENVFVSFSLEWLSNGRETYKKEIRR